VVIDIEGDDAVAFTRYAADALAELPRDTVQQQLLASGLWTALRTRPFSKTPRRAACPPLSLSPPWIPIRWRRSRSRLFWPSAPPLTPAYRADALTDGKVHVCQASGGKLGGHPLGQVCFNQFAGPHPAGLRDRISIFWSR
jgi:Na+-transporting NADH:ubiquinone oxidoreductase subunit A